MARQLAGRSAIGLLTRPFEPRAADGPARPFARSRKRRERGGRGTPLARAAGALGRAVDRVAVLVGAPFAAVWARRRLRLALAVALVVLAVLAGAFLLLRHSGLVAVEKVRMSGVQGPEAHAIEGALTSAARRMSTLDVNERALRAAVAAFPVVREVRASAGFPHSLRITVVEQLPVAVLASAGVRSAVAADGIVLGPALLSSSLPTLQVPFLPAQGQRVSVPSLLASLAVLGAAPRALAARIASVTTSAKGLTVTMQGGLQVIFGDASRPRAKWLSLAAVLADASSAGASYVDVRLPSRPAAGFPGGQPPASASASASGEATQPQGGGSEATVGTLAQGLSASAPEVSAAATEPSHEAGVGEHERSGEPSSAGTPESSGEAEAQGTGAGG
jgi:cell division protein FtsQ